MKRHKKDDYDRHYCNLAIIAGSLAGLFFRKGIPERYNRTILQSISLAIILVGLRSVFKSDDLLMIINRHGAWKPDGDVVRDRGPTRRLGQWFGTRFANPDGGFISGFVMAPLGSMAIIVGAMERGLTGNHQTLYTKSMLDGITAVVFTATLGIGVMFSAIAVFF